MGRYHLRRGKHINRFILSGDIGVADVEQVLADMLECAKVDQCYVNIFDASDLGDAPASARVRWAQFNKENLGAFGSNYLGAVVVLRNPLVRGLLTAVSWMQPFIGKVDFAPDAADATVTAHKWLAEKGIKAT